MDSRNQVIEKIIEIKAELRKLGVWKNTVPSWVGDYNQCIEVRGNDFIEWFQFVYLPNCSQQQVATERHYIVPQAMKFFSADIRKGKLLQLLIELDALS